MARRRGHLLKILCAILPLVLLAPLCLELADANAHYCACGMKKGECSCDLAMHRMKPKEGHCGKMMGVGSKCALQGPRPVKSDVPRVVLDLRHRVGVFEFHGFGFGIDPLGTVETAETSYLPSLVPPPEPPPPRASFPLS
jgi:hypothetical protein